LASHQSEVVADRLELERQLKELEQQYNGKEIPRPAYWGGYLVIPLQ
jgi:pyridoxamine 5'-phosphate oxidase